MKKILFFAFALMALASCERSIVPNKIWDRPEISFVEEELTVSAQGNEQLVIQVNSTGIDDVTIQCLDNYEVDPESGDRLPLEPWAEIVRVVNSYDEDLTRDLPVWESAVIVRVKPNESGCERKAVISASSFTKSDVVTLTQRAE